ncbi:methyl-accepting chemotaxis protein [Kangiella sp. TOML190]|uniref:methyl-accepting chemotaxis protein n=1 Tax=Kangiella sp. TOML190 TaxID=2931351 RepID=UPI00203DEC04|nr:methyl-accepting chemotaxis protein [Kangiella sp. TOML190]
MSETKVKQGKQGSNFIIVLLVLALIAFAVNAIYGAIQSGNVAKRVALASEMKVLSQQISTNATEAAKGTQAAFADLDTATNKFNQNLRYLMDGDATSGLPASPAAIKNNQLTQLSNLWQTVNENTDKILENRDVVNQMFSNSQELNQLIPNLQSQYDSVIDTLLDSRASGSEVHQATRQKWLAERISSGLQKVFRGGEEAKLASENFGQDVDTFGANLEGQLNGDEILEVRRVANASARSALESIVDVYQNVNDRVDYIVFSTPKLFEVQSASDAIFASSDELLQDTQKVETAYTSQTTSLTEFGSIAISGALFALVLLLLVLLYLSQRKAEKSRLKESEVAAEKEKEENAQNQEAIIRLLDEIDSLADGDLTVKATVTEDFTGAIADSFNLTIDQLRGVVGTINDAVKQVSKSTDETQQTSMALAEASRQQAQEITGASAAINEMAASIEQVSTNASESSQVAEKSVEIAKKGGAVVRNTIKGMDTIREQIQETSKRIKRLGESSQEIGNIVSLINDIADQTNILALNAAIQASAAGEAGRGFAVVADEVQRLAERSGNATKQIEALVKTIQNDTNEAVISMEDTTSEVVRGARLAQDAGVSLEEIENVSTNLADLIQSISNAARQQAASAGHVSNTMTIIQEITSQTSDGTTETARSIGELAELSEGLRRSVAGFKLDSSNEDYYGADAAASQQYDEVSIEDMLEQTEEDMMEAEREFEDVEQQIDELDEDLSKEEPQMSEESDFDDLEELFAEETESTEKTL